MKTPVLAVALGLLLAPSLFSATPTARRVELRHQVRAFAERNSGEQAAVRPLRFRPDITFLRPDGSLTSGVRCGTPNLTAPKMAQVERDLAELRPFEERGAAAEIFPNFVDVVFWVLHLDGEGLVDRAQLAAQLDVLNAAYSKAAIQFRFKDDLYYTLDFADAPEYYHLGFESQEESELKAEFREDPTRNLNIYIADIQDDLLGWATFPIDLKRERDMDGVVLLNESLPGGSAAPYNLGDTATHEVGHWFGLYHTFQGGCSAKNDQVSDTPAEREAAYDCPIGRNTCPAAGTDPVLNFMDYTDDSCMNTFSAGQRSRIKAQITKYRKLI